MPYPRDTDVQQFRYRFLRTERDIQREFMALTAEHSFSQVTIGMVCQAAHVSRTTFYQHFTDKFQLLERTLIFLLSIPEPEIHRRTGEPFRKKTLELMKIVAKNCADNREFLQSILNDTTLPAFRSLMSAAIESGIEELFKTLTADSSVGVQLAPHGQIFLSSALFGSLMHWVLNEDSTDLDGFCTQITAFIGAVVQIKD